MIHVGNRIPRQLHRGARKIHLLCKGARPIYLSPEVRSFVLRDWLATHVTTTVRTVADETAFWFELEILLPAEFTGSPEEGWSRPTGDIQLGIFRSDNLTEWDAAGAGWSSAPGLWPQLQPDGRNLWCARAATPLWWQQVLVDYTVTTNRYAKAILGITIARVAVSLPGFPYAMPADAARLQNDLRNAGYPGSVVSSVSRPISVEIKNYTPDRVAVMRHTMVGTEVTSVTSDGVLVPLAYPYSMPGQQAALQTALRSAGYPGAVVTLHGDEWSIFIPSRAAYLNVRDCALHIAPGDPYPYFNIFGEYEGLKSAATVDGTYSNVRAMTGDPLLESPKMFARIGIIPTT